MPEKIGRRGAAVFSTDASKARCLQHEIDHVDGLLFPDRVAGAQAVHARRTCL